ncbi:hypothetical protein Tph_c24100 [Thermacetogenium phaeum DSM 12270]|uniref:Uncharacterized protein n=1 Tax=Thermacetogenium phaeum (strain ATCC BAA-254 / DSM 26808 / PB) TaxID=1089553 RepID=K4LKJ0_THEPS|nr:hypothetical protein [Thermacetogenium phaeum]AFV12597.1 hypothetical protein Tph_c24100 [Thermacetogenium phaeum DSM 12270]
MSDVMDAFEAFSSVLTDNFHKKKVNVEFFCGECCKKAVKGKLEHIDRHVIILDGDEKDIKVITFGDKGPIDIEFVEKIIIPIKNICSVEIPSRDDKRED